MKKCRVESYGNIELRFVNGQIDEVLLFDQKKEVKFHLEWMHDNCYWMSLKGEKKTIDIFFESISQIKFKVIRDVNG